MNTTKLQILVDADACPRVLKEIIYLLEQKNYNSSYEKISIINDYENYFSNTINQLKIAMEFIKLIERVS